MFRQPLPTSARVIGKLARTIPRRGSRIVKKKRTTVVYVISVATRFLINTIRAIVIMHILMDNKSFAKMPKGLEIFDLH